MDPIDELAITWQNPIALRFNAINEPKIVILVAPTSVSIENTQTLLGSRALSFFSQNYLPII